MKEKEEDIKGISHVLEFFNRTAKALNVMGEQHEKNAYMLICVEAVNDKGEERLLSHVAIGGSNKTLESAIYQGLKEDKDFNSVVFNASGRFAKDEIFKGLIKAAKETKEGKE